MKYFITLFLALVFASNVNADNIRYSSYSGRHFFVGFMENEIAIDWNNGGVQLRIYLTATIPTKFEIRMPGFETIRDTLKANEVKDIELPYILENRTSEIPQNNMIEVFSDLPITVYAYSSQLTTSDSYSAIPVAHWGKEYVVMSYPNDQYDDPERNNIDSLFNFTPRSSQFMVLAAYDSTVVTLNLRSVSERGKQVARDYNVVLNKGQSYLVQSFPAAKGMGDLTGSLVRANKPIGLLSGHVRTAVPQTNRYPFDSKDHLIEMLPPTSAWGNFFCSTPFNVNPKGDLFRVSCIQPATTVFVNIEGKPEMEYFLSNPGDWFEITDVATGASWTSNKPIQVVQYMRHTGEFGDSKEYDPSIVVLPPVEQYVQSIVFLTPSHFYIKDQYKEHRLSLVADAAALSDLTLDGVKVRDLDDFFSKPIPNTNFYYGNIMSGAGRHVLTSSRGRFSGILYGIGAHDSYSMSLGNSLTNPLKQDSISPRVFVSENCGFIQGFVTDIYDTNSSGIDYGIVVTNKTINYRWNLPTISDTATVVYFTAEPIDIRKDGHFEIQFFDKNSNPVTYSYQYKGIRVEVPKDVQFPNLSWEAKECKQFKIWNFSNRPMDLDSLFIITDSRLSVIPSKSIPFTLQPGDTVYFNLCFDPKGDSTTLNARLRFYFDCDYVVETPVYGNVQAPKLVANGFDFGRVKVGSTKCATVNFINTGNTDLALDTLDFKNYYPDFVFYMEDMFPKLLKSGDTLKILVCFTPSKVHFFETQVSAINSYLLANELVVLGEGIAPSINSIVLDWGNRRIGTRNDSTMSFTNSGNDSSRIAFKSFTKGLETDENAPLLKSIQTIIKAGESFPLSMSFNPTTTDVYNLRADFSSDWLLHPEISVELKGRGTIPEITTTDFRFDTTRIFINTDSTMYPVLAGGNERLTIDKIEAVSGDISSFDLDLSFFDNYKLPVGERLIVPVKFNPQRVGEHRMILEVTHDANPNYARSKDTIIVSGFALPADTIDFLLDFQVPNLKACIAETGTFKLTNTGNININLQKLDLVRTPDNFVCDFIEDVPAMLPKVLEPNETLSLNLNYYAERNQGGKLRFEMLINDSISRTLEYDVVPQVSSISIVSVDTLSAVPGDTLHVKLTGEIPNGVDPRTDLSFELLVDKYIVELLNKNTILTASTSSGKVEYPIELVQNRNSIKVPIPFDSLNISEKISWEINLVFLALLDSKDATELVFGVFSNKCFDPAQKKIPIKILGVCNFPLRPIKIIANLPFVDIAPNPILDKIGVEVFLTSDDEVTLILSDAMGKPIVLENQKPLGRGKTYLRYPTDSLSSGVYSLKIISKQLNDNIIFVITK